MEHLDLIEGIIVDILKTKWKSFVSRRYQRTHKLFHSKLEWIKKILSKRFNKNFIYWVMNLSAFGVNQLRTQSSLLSLCLLFVSDIMETPYQNAAQIAHWLKQILLYCTVKIHWLRLPWQRTTLERSSCRQMVRMIHCQADSQIFQVRIGAIIKH